MLDKDPKDATPHGKAPELKETQPIAPLALDNSEIAETVKVTDSKAPGGHVVINASDFDEKKHKKFVEPAHKDKDEK